MRILIMDDIVSRPVQMLGKEKFSELSGLGNVDLLYGYTYSPGAVAASSYDILAFHRNFLLDNGWLSDVVHEAAASSKLLILFSGTISENMLFLDGKVLRMNVSDFYTERTVSFFTGLGASAGSRGTLFLRLLYGPSWYESQEIMDRHNQWKRREEDGFSGKPASGGGTGCGSAMADAAGSAEDAGVMRRYSVLVLHNDNLPVQLTQSGRYGDLDLTVPDAFRPEEEEVIENYDAFIDGRLEALFASGCSFDAVLLPYSFSSCNPLEYSGIRTALHLRLTPSWGHQTVPVIFLGPEPLIDVARRSSFGAFLVSGNVFSSESVDPSAICSILAAAPTDASAEWFGRFLDTIKIEPSADYDAPHAVSSEWTIIRWKEMFSWKDGAGPYIDDSAFRGMLYFKYLMAVSGSRAVFRSKHKKSPRIAGLEGKSFVLVDDSADKGWKALLEGIIVSESGGVLHCFDAFDCAEGSSPDTGRLEKAELLAEIDAFLQQPQIADADCYIVDLNLCVEDKSSSAEELTGLEVIRRLRKMNRCNQIVVFTSSSHVGSLRDTFSAMGIAGYALKEDPSDNLDRAESYRMYGDFSQALARAARLAYLKRFAVAVDKYARILDDEEAGLLDDFVDLMMLDMPEYTLKPCVLNVMVFLENYLKRKFRVRDDGFLYSKPDDVPLEEYGERLCFRFERIDGFRNVSDMRVLEEGESMPAGWVEAKDSDIRDMVVPLWFHYGIPLEDCRRVIELKKLRNTRIAHGGGDLPITAAALVSVCSRVIFPVLERDSI